MLQWVLVLGGLTLAAGLLALAVTMRQAERRARRSLFRALGLDDQTVELLMARNGDVLAELTLVRRHAAPPDADEMDAGPAETLPKRLQPTIRFLHAVDGGAEAPAPGAASPELRPPAAGRRRLPHPGRQGRS